MAKTGRPPARKRKVEMQIDAKVHRAATIRAEAQMQSVPDVARAILRRAYEVVHESGLPRRSAAPLAKRNGAPTKRLRFTESSEVYGPAMYALRDVGLSVTRFVESGLEQYARTGRLNGKITLPDLED